MGRIVITGASGFVGGEAVGAALAAGHEVIAIGGRAESDLDTNLGGSEYHALDLSAPSAVELLAPLLEGADAVIHAAAAMAGDDDAHDRGTLAPTRAVLAAIARAAAPVRLVLVSSFAVYGFAAVPEGTLLAELTPLEPEPHKRDAYARAKLAQEEMAVAAARSTNLDLWLIRPGAIYGPGRLDTARLGIKVGGRRLSPGGDPVIPAVDVARVGAALLAAATVTQPREGTVSGPLRNTAVVINLVDTDPPRQSEWAAAVGMKTTALPKRLIFGMATALDLASDLVPGLGTWLPGGLLPPRLAARFRHLRYGTQRAEDILGISPGAASADRLAWYAGQRT
ncbi:NAD(P)-dependent oxidoreductase [Roseibacterium sp. SDUM158017]|uniref:NAD-dependent epimerase/dehydratase family protein n=1 Tax=Roseicyclus salinarum TaxID=3036773 RepID=UPI002414F7C2|nr:NAD(P)-dependent oxidoreductase [Roseibacterium sp. SDUM158017]MDG4649611.1 NAD(P)-dependent oxidoreductase [Roseibacterium sp. SDUM158017]